MKREEKGTEANPSCDDHHEDEDGFSSCSLWVRQGSSSSHSKSGDVLMLTQLNVTNGTSETVNVII